MSQVKSRLLCVFVITTVFAVASPGGLFSQDKNSRENVKDWFQLVDVTIPAQSRYRKLGNIDKPPQLFVLVRRNDKPLQGYYSSTSVIEGWTVKFPSLVKNQFPIRLSDPNSRYTIEVWDNDRFSGNEHVFTMHFDGREILKPLSPKTGERDAVITFKPIQTPEEYKGTNERGWLPMAWDRCSNRVSIWSDNAAAWWSQNLKTYDRLKEGKYDLLQDEVAMRKVCINETRSIEKSLSKLTTADGEEKYQSEYANAEFSRARKLMDEGKVDAAVVEYNRFLKKAIDGGSIAPPLSYIKEALLAPSATYAKDYVQARKSLKISEKGDYSELVIRSFHSGLREALKGDQEHSIAYLSRILNGAADVVSNIDREREDSVGQRGSLLLLSGSAGGAIGAIIPVGGASNASGSTGLLFPVIAGSALENRALAKKIYEEFSQNILKGTKLAAGHEARNRVLLLEFESFKDDSDRSVALLQDSIIKSPLFTAEEIAELKRFRVKLESLYHNWQQVVGLYRIDLPIRVRVLSVSMEFDHVRGFFRDDEEKIQNVGVNLQYIAPLLPHHKDRGTADLFYDLWKRLLSELSEPDKEQLRARSKISPDWLKGMDLKETLGKKK